jgi:hypothetical protein
MIVGKILLAIALAYVGMALASFLGGFIAAILGASLGLSAVVIGSLVWWFPKIIFAGTLLLLYLWDKRRRAIKATAQANAKQ